MKEDGGDKDSKEEWNGDCRVSVIQRGGATEIPRIKRTVVREWRLES